MENAHLIWNEKSGKDLLKNRIFTIRERVCASPEGREGTFSVIQCPDWAIVIPLLERPAGDSFVMVRQWRHGSRSLSLEFPGGVCEAGEEPEAAAARELTEETAYLPGRILKLGEMSPNPAIMTNRVHFFLAENVRDTGNRNLDADEYVDVEIVPAETVIQNMGKPPYIHSLMAAALMLYLRTGGAAKNHGP
ncbi:MAG: NUDIX hydrolase [Spirochaetaceae bacterium]|jgi:8-oxo-dGTP pyrophosphatase MutT (NUDIX family)|nr:NUDIX hydrolase [Spirochaetaceae bacterium]